LSLLDQPDREAISSLVGQRPYLLLLQELEEGIHALLAEMQTAKTDEHVLKLARLWQIFYHYWSVLRNNPEKIKQELNEELNEYRMQYTYQAADPHAPTFSETRSDLLNQIETRLEGKEPQRSFEFPELS